MPHIDICMLSGRTKDLKEALAIKLRDLLAKELAIDAGYVSVSIRDIERSDWEEELRKILDSSIVIPPAYR